MDNNELDKILKEKLENKIKPSAEFERKIAEKVEQEKTKMKSKQENISNSIFKKVEHNKPQEKPKVNRYKRMAKVLSMAAVIMMVFTLGMNMKTPQIIKNNGEANLISIKAIEPTKSESGVLANDSEFTIYAEGENLNVEAIQKSIYVEPALDYTIEKTSNKNEYKLKFKQNIPDNTIVKLQYVKNQITEDSWAYQTSDKLSVTSTYPDKNAAEDLSEKSVIDINLSYASVENFEKYVKITPSVKGIWTHLGKTWRFKPEKEFKEGTRYTVTISKELKAENQKLGEDYIFSFKVSKDDSNTVGYDDISIDGIVTAKTDESAKIMYNSYSGEEIKFGKVEISRFSNIDDFIQYVENNNPEKAVKQGEYEVENRGTYLELKKSLPKGYYAAKITNTKGKELFTCPIQITDYSAYAMETERDVLVWVAQGKELSKNVKVEYLGKNVNTDSQGIAKFENIADGSEKIKYAKVGNELVIGVYNYDLENYPQAYVYTDRPLYKNTDTINIWGFVPKSFFYTNPTDDFYIELGNEQKQKINVEKDGNFTYKIKLNNHFDDESVSVGLYYKDTYIGGRYVTIENYELQNYTYEVIANKNYGFAGEKLEFDVKVGHITGLLVPNKKVTVIYEDETYTETTGDDGIAHFKITLTGEDSNETDPRYQGVSIYNGDEAEYTNAETYFETWLLTRNSYTENRYIEDDENKVTLYKLDTNKNVKVDYELKDLRNGTYETNVDINLVEEETTRIQVGEVYDEYLKKNVPSYEYNTESNVSKIKKVKSTNGEVIINKNEIKTKKNTDDKTYNYHIRLEYKDLAGRDTAEDVYMYNGYEHIGEGIYLGESMGGSDSKIYEAGDKINIDRYHTYRYLLANEATNFSIGSTTEFTLSESTTNGIKEIANSGKLLTILFKENIYDTNILTENKFSHKYEEKDFPGFKMTSAYFVDGKFYRMPVQYFDFNEQDKKVDIEITSDKDEYKPGDTVTLNIKTTKNGKAVKSFVNVSVVNEAVFEIEEDITNLLETIYSNKAIPVYTYSSYTDTLNGAGGGEGGGDGGPRGNFADTAHFETVYTDASGTAKVTFKLPDNVTTYRVTAQSGNENLEFGVSTKQIVSKLDFFVQSVEPRSVKTSDDVVLNATAIANTKYDVDYEFTIKEINKTLTAKGKTNNLVSVNFGKLPYGTYHAIVKGKHENQEDAIEYEFKVVEATQEVKTKTTMNINSDTKITPTKNPIKLEIYNKNMSKYVEYMDFVESTLTERLDTQIAYNKVQELKDKYYGTENASILKTEMSIHQGERYLKNLRSGKDDMVLTALAKYYANDYCGNIGLFELDEKDNIFEYYLIAAASNEPVLNDLLYLKQEKDISNYNKLLVTLGLEFAGDFQNAKTLYGTIQLSDEEAEEYKSIATIIETFINKKEVTTKIDDLIKNKPADEYLRFAILSYFQNNSNEIGKEETVKITSKNLNETITVNGMQVKTYTIYNEDLSDISFETESNDLMVSYYYQTSLENIESKNIKKDIKTSISGDLEKGNSVDLKISFEGEYEGEVRIALPNSLRMAQGYHRFDIDDRYYIQNNKIDYITIYKTKRCKSITLPLLATNSGKYKFENVVCTVDGVYHISNSIDLKIK